MKLVVNGAEVEVDDRHAKTPLLWVLRDVLGLHGTKFGCGAGFCAACTVLIDGRNTKSCQTATERAVGKAVTTVEGASGPVVDAVRDAWHRGNVVQCGYCQPGQTLAAVSLLESDPSPDDAKIDDVDEREPVPLRHLSADPGRDPCRRRHAEQRAPSPGPLVAPAEPEDRTAHGRGAGRPGPSVHPDPPGRDDRRVLESDRDGAGDPHRASRRSSPRSSTPTSIRSGSSTPRTEAGPNGDVYGNPDLGSAFQLTGASNSMKGFWVRYRLAAAQARARLVAAAAEAWEVPADEVEVENGVLRHASGRQATFAELAARAEQLPVPDGVEPKDPADYKLIGREGRLRVDAVPKILGTTQYTIDLSLPGMLTAVVLHPPRFGATVASVDDQAALAEAGVTAVVPIDEGVAVVAETVADAQRGLRALVVEWDDTHAERRSTAELLAEHLRLLESGENAVTARDDGDVDRALADAASTVDATYTLPYLAHAPMEPNNAACRMREDGVLEVWVGSEAPEYVKMNASSIAGIDKEQVEVHITFAGGSFGLHSSAEHDPTAEAVQIARALDWKHPIKVQSLREEEFKVGRYRAMAVHRVRAGADADGRLTAWHQQIVAAPTSVNLPFVRDVMFTNGVDFFTTTGAVDPPYAVENFRLESTNFESRDPDDGVAIGRQLPHRVRARVGDRRARDRRRPRPRRPAARAARREPADTARARARGRAR